MKTIHLEVDIDLDDYEIEDIITGGGNTEYTDKTLIYESSLIAERALQEWFYDSCIHNLNITVK